MQLSRLLNLFKPTIVLQLSQQSILAQMDALTLGRSNYIIPEFNYERILREGYESNDIFYSVVNKIAKKCAAPKWSICRVQDEEAYKSYKFLISNPKLLTKDTKKALALRKKALVIDESHYLNKLYARPNKMQGWAEYFESRVIYYLTVGNSFIYAPQSDIDGFKLKKGLPLSFNILPSDKMFIETTNFPIEISSFYLQDMVRKDFTTSEVIHTKTFNPHWDMQGRQLFGMPPILPAWPLIMRNNEADQAAYDILKKRGARKALGFDIPTHLTGDQAVSYSKRNADALDERFDNKNKRYKDQVIPIAGKINGVDLSISLDEIDYDTTYTNGLKRICNLFGINSALFNDNESSTYNNANQFLKEFVTGCVMQVLNTFKDCDNRFAQDNWGLGSFVIDYDPTCFTELQDDLQSLSSALSLADWLTDNEKRGYMNEGEYEGENAEQANNLYKNTENVSNTNKEPTT